MIINYRRDVWKVYDFFLVLRFIAEEDFEKNFEENFGIKVNEKVLNFIDHMKNYIDFENEVVKFFFNEDTRRIFHVIPFFKMKNVKSLDEVLKIYNDLTEEEMRFYTIQDYYLNNAKNFDEDIEINEAYVRLVLDSSKATVDFIDNLDISMESRWRLMRFLQNPREMIEEYMESLEGFVQAYKKEIGKYQSIMNDFEEHIQGRIDKEGDRIFSDIFDELMSPKYYEEIEIRTSFIGFYGFRIDGGKNNAVISVGFEYLKVLEEVRGKDKEEEVIKVMNTLTDAINVKILKSMKTKERYGKEIADITGLSKAVVSYHMKQLIDMGLINIRREGKRIYYSIRKERIESSIESLKNYYI